MSCHTTTMRKRRGFVVCAKPRFRALTYSSIKRVVSDQIVSFIPSDTFSTSYSEVLDIPFNFSFANENLSTTKASIFILIRGLVN